MGIDQAESHWVAGAGPARVLCQDIARECVVSIEDALAEFRKGMLSTNARSGHRGRGAIDLHRADTLSLS
jgi:hypothetical protein